MSGAIWGGSSYSDMVYFTNPTSKAGVIDTGNNIWIGDLRSCSNADPHCAEPTIARVTNNILWLFGQGPAGALEPAASNVAAISPVGS